MTVTREDTEEQLYQNAFATDFEVSETTVKGIVRDGRTRWKVENENNNVLKTRATPSNTPLDTEANIWHRSYSYYLLLLNLLAFLFHTVLDLVDEQYRAICQALGTRRRFFQDVEALLRYFQFGDWDDVLAFMFKDLELGTANISRCLALLTSAAAKRTFGSPVHFLEAALFRCLTICQSLVDRFDLFQTNGTIAKSAARLGILRVAAGLHY